MIFHISIFQTFFSDQHKATHYSYHFHRCLRLAIFFRFFLCLRSKHKRIVFSVHVACVPTVGHITKVRVDLLHYRNILLAYKYCPTRYCHSANFHSDFFATLAACATTFSDIRTLLEGHQDGFWFLMLSCESGIWNSNLQIVFEVNIHVLTSFRHYSAVEDGDSTFSYDHRNRYKL